MLETTSRHMRSHGYPYGSRYGPGARKSSSNSTGGRTRNSGYRRHSNAAGAAAAADDDEDIYALEMLESLGGRRIPSSDTALFGAALGLGYNARVTTSRGDAAGAAALGGGGGGGADRSEECILPPPPANAITKRTEVVVQES